MMPNDFFTGSKSNENNNTSNTNSTNIDNTNLKDINNTVDQNKTPGPYDHLDDDLRVRNIIYIYIYIY